MMSTPTLAEVLSPYLADMRIKAANLRQGAPRIAEFADVADWIDGWELAIATAAQNVGTSTPETATPESTGPERVNPLGGSPQEQGTLDAGACERCTPEDGDCLNAGCNRAAPDLRAAIDDARAEEKGTDA